MKVSTKFRYGLRAMIDLAMYEGDVPVLAQDIADRQQVSKKYLEHLLASLKAGGLVRSIRGSKGGYRLARPAKDITAEEVGLATEGDLSVIDCLVDPTLCPRTEICATHELWADLGASITSVLRSTTLDQLVKIAKRKEASTAPMYHI